jgi:hypothetical protein
MARVSKIVAVFWTAICAVVAIGAPARADTIPSFLGTWTGKTDSIGDVFGLRSRDRTVHITEQTDRRFRGYFEYEAGRKDFVGIIHPDNVTFNWVSNTSKGYTNGRFLDADHISACYVESGAEATAGCSDLKRVVTKK